MILVPTSTSRGSLRNTEVKSPIIGTAYHAPEPGAKKFAEVGKKIKKGETVMIVEAMKTMNHVPSTADGIIKKISEYEICHSKKLLNLFVSPVLIKISGFGIFLV